MPQQISDVLANADCSPQGLDGGLNLKGDPTRLSPPATTRSDNASYSTVGSVGQLPGLVSQGLNGALHVYNLHSRDPGSPAQQGDVLLHGEFPDGSLGYTSPLWSLANSPVQFIDQPVLPFSLRMRNIAGRLNSSGGAVSPLAFARQEMLPSNGRRKYALATYVSAYLTTSANFTYTIGYTDGLTETQTGFINISNAVSFYDVLGIQKTNQFAIANAASGGTTLEIHRVDFDTQVDSVVNIGGFKSIGTSLPFQLVNHAGNTYLAYYTDVATPLLTFYDVRTGAVVNSTIGGTLTPGFAVFSPYSHQAVSGVEYLFAVKNNSVYALARNGTGNFALVGGAVALPASSKAQSGTPPLSVTGTAIINDKQGGVGGNAKFLVTIFRTFPETLQMANGTTPDNNITNICVDQLTFTAHPNGTGFGTLTLVSSTVLRLPGGGTIAGRAFNSCPSESYFAGAASSKQALCLIQSNETEYGPGSGQTGTTTYSQPTNFLIDQKARIVGRFLESSAAGANRYCIPHMLFGVPTDRSDDSAALTITMPVSSLVNANFPPPTSLNNVPFYMAAPVNVVYAPMAATLSLSNTAQSPPAVQAGPYTIFSGALTSCHDGFQVAESNYHFATPNPVPRALTSGTVLGSAGTYYYVAVHEHTDAQGQTVRSTPSKPVAVTVTGNFFGASVAVPCLPTSKMTVYPNRLVVRLYRSLRNQLLDKNYYLCATAEYSGASDTSRTNNDNNNVACYDGTIIDNAALTASSSPPPPNAINAQPRLYTGLTANASDATYPSSPPRPFFYQTASKNRAFGLAQHFGQYRVYYTALNTSGFAPEWNDFNFVAVPPDIGDARSIEAQDSSIVIFGTRYIATFSGDGPPSTNATGVPVPGEGFSSVQPIPTPAGVIGSGSPTRIPEGLIYQGQSGIQLIDRGSIVNPIGAAVDPYTGRQVGVPGQIFGRGVTLPSLQSVVWPNAKGPALVYSYLTKKYSLWPLLANAVALVQRLDGNVHAALQPIVGIQLTGPGLSGAAGADFGVLSALQHSPICLVGNSDPGLVLETPWILPAGASGGEARVWNVCITGTWFGPHTLQVEQAYNYENYSLTRTIDMSTQPRQYQAIIQPLANTRMVSVRYRISLLPLTNLQAGFPMASLADLVLFSAKQQGTTRSSAALRG